MIKHTEGPWLTDGCGVVSDKGDLICAACFEDGCLYQNAENNMRLVAAAPTMLEALRGILDIGKRDLSNPKYDGYFESAREAVKRATGGES